MIIKGIRSVNISETGEVACFLATEKSKVVTYSFFVDKDDEELEKVIRQLENLLIVRIIKDFKESTTKES